MKDKILPFVKQSMVYGIGGLAIPLAGILLVPIYTRVFTPDDYGVINLVQITITFLTVLLVLGLDNASGRYYLDSKSDSDRKLTASTTIIFLAIVMLVGCLVFIGFSGQISQILFKMAADGQYLVIAAASLPMSICAILCLNLLRFNLRPVSYTVLSVASILLTVLITILLVVVLKIGIKGVFIATLISASFFFIINLAVTRNYFSFAFSKKRLKELLLYGLPLVPYGIAIYLMQNCDRYFLAQFATLEDVGIYNLGGQIASISSLFFISTGLAWSPFIYLTYKEDNIGAVYTRLLNYFVAAAALIVVGLSIFSHEILMVFATRNYYSAYTVIPLLTMSLTFFYLGLRMCFGISIAKKTLHFTWISIVSFAVNVGLNFLLVPLYGMIGAATATLSSSVVWCILLVHISQRYYVLKYSLGSFLGILAVSLAIICVAYFLLIDVSWKNILIKIILLGVFLVFVYLFKLVGNDELKYIYSLLSKLVKKQ